MTGNNGRMVGSFVDARTRTIQGTVARRQASTEVLDAVNGHIKGNEFDLGENEAVSMPALASFREEHQITLKGTGDAEYEPMYEYDDAPFSPSMLQIFKRLGYTAPTPIQAQSWPIALAGRDIISVARTGSGKTCGFLMPAFHKLMLDARKPKTELAKPVQKVRGTVVKSEGGRRRYQSAGTSGKNRPPKVLVLAPTRELVCQIEEEAQKYTRAAGVWATCLYGGTPKPPQIRNLRSGVDIVIATPGRCNDLADMGVLDLSEISYLVLDEADRMLDMGFEPQIRQIIEQVPDQRQSLFFTATWPREVRALASEFLNGPVHVSIGDQGGQLTANKAISQYVKIVREREKEEELFKLLNYMNPSEDKAPNDIPKSIIFVGRKSACDDLAYTMRDQGFQVDTLHGDKSQYMRTKAIDRFKSGRLRVLIATDVAARGLDVKDIEAVINYDFPVGGNGVEDYVHRIGRTARGNNKGLAYTFFTQGDRQRAAELVGVLERADQDVPADLMNMVSRGGRGGGGGKGGYNRRGGSGGYNRRGGGYRGGGSGGYSRGGGGRLESQRDGSYSGGGYARRGSGSGGGGGRGNYNRRDQYSSGNYGSRSAEYSQGGRSFQGGGGGYRQSNGMSSMEGKTSFFERFEKLKSDKVSGGGSGGGGRRRPSNWDDEWS